MVQPVPDPGSRSKEAGGAGGDPAGMIRHFLFQATSENGFVKVVFEKATCPGHRNRSSLWMFASDL
jgi:hypothetical protein